MVDVLSNKTLSNDDPNSGISTIIPGDPDSSGQNMNVNSSGQDNTGSVQGSSGSGSFGPPGKEHFPVLGETPKSELEATSESSPPPESFPSAEKPGSTPEAPKPKALQEESAPTPKTPTASKGRVVDERNSSPVSTIGNFSDPTTAYADKKEADFIAGVKDEHGSS